tara:strand:- start:493 stop:915 length:423 start_codon:yes stop_codon:yes gene_type:complete
MKRNELKQVLKPLIKQCIKEVILEEGVLSSVVSEVVKGMGASTIVEQKPAPVKEERLYNVNSDSTISRINESRKQLMDAINKDAYNGVDIFENVEPISSAGSPTTAPAASGPLAGQDPNDPGVNITGIMKIAAGKWNKFL